jgi:hypothetical protein
MTIIKDAVQGSQLLKITLTAGNLTRITGIEIQDGGRTNFFYGILAINGSSTNGAQYRMDHCKIININGIEEIDTVIGVIDHNTIVTDNGASPPWHIHGTRWADADFGDGSWVEPVVYGSSKFLFIEDNTFSHATGTQSVTDGDAGARWVIRHNTLNGGYEVDNHGTESTGRPRGCRAMEIYNNTFNGDSSNRFLGGSRSGGVLIHDNSIRGYWGALAVYGLNNFRSVHAYTPWGGADGTNPWDKNVAPAAFTGTAAANSSRQTVTASGANWTTNQWAGYTLRRTTAGSSLPFTVIISNTSNTLTYVNNVIYGGETATSFAAGDSLEIRKVDIALDQPGAGAVNSMISGGYSPVVPPGWNQVVEPCYSWNNIDESGNHINFGPNFPSIRQNIHFFNDTPMPGYTPYTYPHPLVQGGQPSPTPTSTPAPTPTATATSTATPNPTPSPSPSATLPPTPTPTATTTATATPTATAPPRRTPKPRPSRPPR